MDVNAIKPAVLALAVPLTEDELESVAHLANCKLNALRKLPPPRKPGLVAWFRRVTRTIWQRFNDLKAMSKELKRQHERIVAMEIQLKRAGLPVPKETV